MKWWQKAAAQGNGKAEQFISGLYGEGKGVSKDKQKEKKWLFKAAADGNADSEYRVDSLYASGEGVTQDY